MLKVEPDTFRDKKTNKKMRLLFLYNQYKQCYSKINMEIPNQNQYDVIEPIIESKITKSKDGKWIIHETTIVDIKPVAHLKEILKDLTD